MLSRLLFASRADITLINSYLSPLSRTQTTVLTPAIIDLGVNWTWAWSAHKEVASVAKQPVTSVSWDLPNQSSWIFACTSCEIRFSRITLFLHPPPNPIRETANNLQTAYVFILKRSTGVVADTNSKCRADVCQHHVGWWMCKATRVSSPVEASVLNTANSDNFLLCVLNVC